MPSRFFLTDIPVWVDQCDYARFCTTRTAALAKDLDLRPSLECIHGRRLYQQCYQCRLYGMSKEEGPDPKTDWKNQPGRVIQRAQDDS